MPYIFDLLDSKVSVSGDTRLLGLDVNDDEQRIWCVALEKLVDFEIRSAKLGARVVPTNELLACVNFLEHLDHRLDVVVVKEPHRRVLVILFEGNCAEF